MKWKKIPYNDKANTHRAGWKWWDLLDDEGDVLCTLRFKPDSPFGRDYQLAAHYFDDRDKLDASFYKLKEAKDHAVAYFVNKRLEEAHG